MRPVPFFVLALGLTAGCFVDVDPKADDSGEPTEGDTDTDGDADGDTDADTDADADADADSDTDTDPDADDDGDGLTNAEEAIYGTDPNNRDSDGDGHEDGDEVSDGTNPMYEYSHVYTGGYNVGYCEDGTARATGPTGTATFNHGGTTYRWDYYQPGDVVENFTLRDQHGEEVDLYSFCGHHITITFGAFW
jgi:hypothetical protein